MMIRGLGLVAVGALVVLAGAMAVAGTVEGRVTHPRGTANIVVYVATAPGTFRAPDRHVVMDQKGMQFVPHVVPVVRGTTVDFKNSDHLTHNVFSPDGEGYNLGTWGYGEVRPHTFATLGVYSQLCSLHPEMEGFVIVLQNPYFAVTRADGSFTIPNVPDGQYTLKVWGQKLRTAEKNRTFQVQLQGGHATTNIDFH
jgi:plastocyanin